MVKIPKANITENINGRIAVTNAQVRTCPAFYADSTNSELQDYAITADAYEKASTYAEISLKTNNAILEILKIDEETKEVIPNTTFQISKDNTVVATVTTNSNGVATLNNLYAGRYEVKEINANANYVLNNKVKTVELKYGETTNIQLKNEHKKGQIKIIKTSEDDNLINGQKAGTPIANVKFKVYDYENNLVDEIITSKDGTATTKLLNTGCYFIKEVESGEYYLLNENIFTAQIKEHQEIVEVEITNKSEKPSEDEDDYTTNVYTKEIEVKKLPQTGF